MYAIGKRQWTLALSAAATIGVGLLIALIPNQGAALIAFATRVAPGLRGGSIHVRNQALGAWLAQLATPDTNLLDFTVGVGGWGNVGIGLVLGLLGWYLYRHRSTPLTAAGMSTVILLALLAGPISWDHYLSWAVIPVVLLSQRLHGRQRLLLGACALLLAFPVSYLTPEIVAAQGWLRILTGTQTLALLGMALLAIASTRPAPAPEIRTVSAPG